jgi:hypothetical protein
VEDDSADHLNIVVTLANGPFGGFAYRRESLREDLIENGALNLATFFIFSDPIGF